MEQEAEYLKEPSHASYGSRLEDEMEYASCLAVHASETDDLSGANSLLCNELIAFGDARLKNPSSTQVGLKNPSSTQVDCDICTVHQRDSNAGCGIGDLDNLELDSPPDFQLTVSSFPCYFYTLLNFMRLSS